MVALSSASLVATTQAGAASMDAKWGKVTATFTYSGSFPQSRNGRLTIVHAGTTIASQLVTSKWCGHSCWPDTVAPGTSVVHLVHLRRHGPLEVVLTLYSGGAHCCTIEQVYSFKSESRHLQKVEYDFGDPGVKLVPIGPGTTYDFLSADDAFAYAFTDYAASGMPIKILSFTNGAFLNVTRRFPRLVARDASQWHRAFVATAPTHYQDTVGVAAAFAADEDLLGHYSKARAFLFAQAKALRLNSALSPLEPDDRPFVHQLQIFLKKNGYLPS
jgi:hypothetical protein